MLRNTWQLRIVNLLITLPGLTSGTARMPCLTVSSTWARCVFQRPGWRACSSSVLYMTGRPPADRLHVLGERLPLPRHAGLQHVHRDRFDVRQHPGELLALVAFDRRQRERAVADDDGGRAVVAGERAERIPEDLRVVVAVV